MTIRFGLVGRLVECEVDEWMISLQREVGTDLAQRAEGLYRYGTRRSVSEMACASGRASE